jgi:hypothetical protein
VLVRVSLLGPISKGKGQQGQVNTVINHANRGAAQ